MLSFLRKPYYLIFERLYTITNGRIILGGSASLKYQNVIVREVNDIDVNILYDDWKLYEVDLCKHFKFYKQKKIVNNKLGFEFDSYLAIDKELNRNFDLFINFKNDFYNTKNEIRVVKPEFMLLDKQWILETEPDLHKHQLDIDSIKKWIDEK